MLDVIQSDAMMTVSIVSSQNTAPLLSVRDQYEGSNEEDYCNQNISDHGLHLETEKYGAAVEEEKHRVA